MKLLSNNNSKKQKWELFIFWIVRKEENSCVDDNNNWRANWIHADQFLSSIILVHVVWWVICYKIYLWKYSNSGRNVMICKECPKFLLGLFFSMEKMIFILFYFLFEKNQKYNLQVHSAQWKYSVSSLTVYLILVYLFICPGKKYDSSTKMRSFPASMT